MLGSIFSKGRRTYLPLSAETDQEEDFDKANIKEKKWHPDLWSAAIGFFVAVLAGLTSNTIYSNLNSSNSNKLQQLLHIPVETVVFQRNETFIEPSSKESDQAWEALIPGKGRAHGFIAIDHPEQYGLPPGKQSGPHTQNFGVSMYHQLHCLISIREIFWGLLTGSLNASEYHMAHPSGRETTLTMRVDLHTNHCFDYLRQGIMCAADMSLEGTGLVVSGMGMEVGKGEAVTGWGMRHECRSWDAARRVVEEHQLMERFED